jgi:hypothetical protein
MRSLSRIIAAIACLALWSCGAPQHSLERRLFDSHNLLRHAGFSGLGPIASGELASEGSRTLRARFARDACYVVAAFGSDTLEDIGLTVVGPDEAPLTEERGTGRTAIASFCAQRAGEHLITITAEAGAGGYQVAYWFGGDAGETTAGGASQNQLTLGRPVNGTLSPGQQHVDYTFSIQQRRSVTIDLESRDFDTYLYMLRDGTVIARNDDGGNGLNSRLTMPLEPGTYTVRVGSFMDRGAGQFSVVVR